MISYTETEVSITEDWTTKIRADWSQAACPVQYLNIYDEWSSTPYQVADFRHSAAQAAKTVAAWLAAQ